MLNNQLSMYIRTCRMIYSMHAVMKSVPSLHELESLQECACALYEIAPRMPCCMACMMICDLTLSRQKKTPMVLDTITNGIVYEVLARSDKYLNKSNFL